MKKILNWTISLLLFALLASCGHRASENAEATHNHEAGHNHDHDHAGDADHDHDHEGDEPVAAAGDHAYRKPIVLTPEQIAEAGISTQKAERKPFGEVIPAIGEVLPLQGDQATVTARSEGVILFDRKVYEGTPVASGERLLAISSEGMSREGQAEQLAREQLLYEAARSRYERNVELSKNQLVTLSELQQSETDYRSAELRLNNLKKGFQDGALRVTAPQAGYVTEVFVNQGDYVTIGQPLFTVSKNRDVVLRAEVSPQYVAQLPQVVSANFRTSAGADFFSVQELGGRVISYGRQIDPQSHLIPFYFSVPYRTDFVAGSFAEIKLVMRDGAPQIVVPKEALVEDFGLFFVYTKDDHGFEKREVLPAGSDGRRVAIKSGIAEGEEIVTAGAPRLKLIERLGSLGAEAAHAGHSH